MGISAGGSKGGPKNDINVTPLVDVVLVLLIIFIVTMPIMMQHITIEVPRTLEADEVSVVTTQISICGNLDGSIDISDGANTETVPRGALAKTLRARLEQLAASEKVVFVDFDDNLPWEQVVSAMDSIKGVGKTGSSGEREPVKVALKVRENDQSCVMAR